MLPTHSSRPRSPSSTRSPISAKASAPTFRTSRAAWASITASARNSCTPGPGFGGSCFPKDTIALLKTAHDHGAQLRIVETVSAVNEQRKRAMARKVIAALDGPIRRQDDRGSRTDLQAQHRRHARLARDSADRGLAGHRRQGASFRSGRDGAGEAAIAGRDLLLTPTQRRGRRRAGDHDRVGAIPRARSRPAKAGSWRGR